MWFVFLSLGLALLITGGLYCRRRLGQSLLTLGVSPRRVRVARWGMTWLLYGVPLLVFLSVLSMRLLGWASLPLLDGPIGTWLLIYPFILALLVVLQTLPYLFVFDLVRAVARRRASEKVARVERTHARLVLLVMAAFTLYTPARILAERGDVRVRHWALGSSTGEGALAASAALPRSGAPVAAAAALPAGAGGASPPFRIAFIADLQQDAHTGEAELADVISGINEAKPDVVLSGGDWISSGPEHIGAAAASAGALKSRLGTFSVRGDHEHFAYMDRERSVAEMERALTQQRVALLNNEVRWFEHAGKRIGVLFLNYNYIFRTDDAKISKLVASLAGADYSIVVTHQFNDRVAGLVKDKVDLVLAGHTHGGQVNPVIGLFHVSLARLETRYIDGLYQLGSTAVLTTAGIGYSIVPLRYASPGSIELIDLRL